MSAGLLLTLLVLTPARLLGQPTPISGVVNVYQPVTALGTNTVTVSDGTAFSCNDRVLLYQAQGAATNTSNSSSAGSITSLNNAGRYEFANVVSVAGNVLTLDAPSANLGAAYDLSGQVQVIRVPVYQSAEVTATLTAAPWDGAAGTGGVLALEVQDTLILNAGIDVSGLGFRGGRERPPQSCPSGGCGSLFNRCTGTDWTVDYPGNDLMCEKGEGIGGYIPTADGGKGANANGGGGGGNGAAGGGGGANYGAGGTGGDCGNANACFGGCSRDDAAGQGGRALNGLGYSAGANRVFLGGGGGAGNNGNSTEYFNINSNGTPGGGLVFIRCDRLEGNGQTIAANGLDGNVFSGQPSYNPSLGAYGAGAGGAVLLEYNDLNGGITASAEGGRGADTKKECPSCPTSSYDGPGGGGGGGMVWVAGGSLAGVTTQVQGGQPGISYNNVPNPQGNRGATAGGNGSALTNWSPPTVPLSTGGGGIQAGEIAATQTLCSGGAPAPFTDVVSPTGTNLQIDWISGPDSSVGPWSATGASGLTYTAPAPASTIYYRRVVTDPCTGASDSSNAVGLIVPSGPLNAGVLRSNPGTIFCPSDIPPPVYATTPASGGTGSYTYSWEIAIDGVTFNPVAGAINDTLFFSAPINGNTVAFIQRTVSDGCNTVTTGSTTYSLGNPGDPSFSGLSTAYCTDHGAELLTTVDPGGTFYLNGSPEPNPIVIPSTVDTFELIRVVDDGSCQDTFRDTFETLLPINPNFTGVPTDFCGGGDTLFPSPATPGGVFRVDNGTERPDSLLIPATPGPYTVWYKAGRGECIDSASQSVQVRSLPDASFSGIQDSFCNTGDSVDLSPTVAGGQFSLDGTDFAGTRMALPGPGGPYVVRYIIDDGNCQDTVLDTFRVISNPDPSYSLSDTQVCGGGQTITLSPATAGGDLYFDGSLEAGLTFTAPTSPGNYPVRYVVTENNCTDTLDSTFTVSAVPDAGFTGLQDSFCNTGQTVDLAPNDSTGQFALEGADFPDSSFALPMPGGPYVVRHILSNAACADTARDTFRVLPFPDASFLGIDTAYCGGGQSLTLLPVTNGGTFTFDGATLSSTSLTLPTTPGDYPLSHRVSIDGCADTVDTTVSILVAPDAGFTGLQDSFCNTSQTVDLAPNDSTGQFALEGADFPDSSFALPGPGGPYVVRHILSNAACADTARDTFRVFPFPDASFLGIDTAYCGGGQSLTLLPVTNGGTFTFDGATLSSTSLTLPTTPGDYPLSHRVSIDGCADTVDTTVGILVAPDAGFTGLQDSFCNTGQTVDLLPNDSTGQFALEGADFPDSSFVLPVPGGPYVVRHILSNAACADTARDTFRVFPFPDPTFSGFDTLYCGGGQSVSLNPATPGGTVYFDNTQQPGLTFSLPTTPGLYPLRHVLEINGCADTADTNIRVRSIPDPAFTGLQDSFCNTGQTISLSPATSGGQFSLNGANFPDSSFALPSTAGQYVVAHTVSQLGCDSTARDTFQLVDFPDPAFSGFDTLYCGGGQSVSLNPVSPGGQFFLQFSPLAGTSFTVSTTPSTYNLRHIVSVASCADTLDTTFSVRSIPDPTFSGLQDSFCNTGQTVSLSPATSGGQFSLNGANFPGTSFALPSTAGQYVVAHTVSQLGCDSTARDTFQLVDFPDPAFSGFDTLYCGGGQSVSLNPVSPGGQFFLQFSPLAGTSFTVSTTPSTYNLRHIVSVASCADTLDTTFSVRPVPDSDFSMAQDTFCNNGQTVLLAPNNPFGQFSLDGSPLAGNSFPLPGTAGSYVVQYRVEENGCADTTRDTFQVVDFPDPNFGGLDTLYCDGGQAVPLSPNTPGGQFALNGVDFAGTVLNTPSNPSLYNLRYTVSVGGCQDSASANFRVRTTPNASFSGLQDSFCNTPQTVNLNPQVAGGQFALNGVNFAGTSFTLPTGAGQYTVRYILTNGGCADTTRDTFQVFDLPNPNFSGFSTLYCGGGQPVVLTPVTPGGVFQLGATPLAGNSFTVPTTSNTYTLRYRVAQNGCVDSTSNTFQVRQAPSAAFASVADTLCNTGDTLPLNPVTAGGQFALNGANFSGSALAIPTTLGQYFLRHIVTGNGCQDTVVDTFRVFNLPNASFTGFDTLYCGQLTPVTLTPNTPGGTFLINNSPQANPISIPFNAGNYTLGYTVEVNGCTDTVDTSFTVAQNPVTNFAGLLPSYCQNEADTLNLTPSKPGGSFRLEGQLVNMPLPVPNSPGLYTVSYSDTLVNCIDSTVQTFRVRQTPNTTLGNLQPFYCARQGLVDLQPATAGGTLTRDGLPSPFTFNTPDTGQYTLVHTVNNEQCVEADTFRFEVRPLPTVGFTGILPSYCVGEATAFLQPIAPDGDFLISGGLWREIRPGQYPLPQGPGVYNMGYTRQLNGCRDTVRAQFEIKGLPNASFSNIPNVLCYDSLGNLNPVPAIPGGTFVLDGAAVSAPFRIPAPGLHTLDYRVTVEGCENTSSQTFLVQTPPELEPVASYQPVCENQRTQVVLSATLDKTFYSLRDSTGFVWAGPVESNGGELVLEVDTLPADTHQLDIVVANTVCSDTLVTPFFFEVLPVPNPRRLQQDSLTLSTWGYPIDLSVANDTGSLRYRLVVSGLGDQTPGPLFRFDFPETGAYPYTLYTRRRDLGCQAVYNGALFVERKDRQNLPNGFSPNDDGLNDRFEFPTLQFRDARFRVFNRAGEMVYDSAEDPTLSWDGRKPDGSACKEDVYIYRVDFTDSGGQRQSATGNITLVR